MYTTLLALHSFFRWIVLITLLIAIVRSWQGWLGNKQYTKQDNILRNITASAAHIQLILGVWLYFISPVISYFLSNFNDAVHNRQIRFFGMEHSIMMLLGITLITIGSAKAKRKAEDKEKFKTMAIWFTIGLLVILSSVPWGFSPLVSRPYFRGF